MVTHEYLPYLRIVGHVCLSQLAGTDWVLGGVCRYESRSDTGPSPSQCYTGAVLCCPVSHRCYSPYMGAVLYRCYPYVSQVPRCFAVLFSPPVSLRCSRVGPWLDPAQHLHKFSVCYFVKIRIQFKSTANTKQVKYKARHRCSRVRSVPLDLTSQESAWILLPQYLLETKVWYALPT